jgi:hypothetical protein
MQVLNYLKPTTLMIALVMAVSIAPAGWAQSLPDETQNS